LGGAKVGGCSFGHRFLLSVGLRFDSFAQVFGIKTFGQNAIFWVERFGFPTHFLGTQKLTGWFQS
jgi:hypothetical protein